MNFNEKGVKMGSQVGLLDLSPDLLETLICTDPITDHFKVEMTPFARGKFAAVRRVQCLRTGEYYAAKVVRRRRRGFDVRYETLHEAAVLALARENPKIVRLHKVFEGPTEMTLILELASGGELQRVIDEEERIQERVVREYLVHILVALRFLHSHNIAHLDLKPQNLLLTGTHPGCEVKLCDFGISRVIQTDIEVREVLGTLDYVSPEILQYEPLTLATDMWSVGVLAYVLLTGHSPFGGDTKQETYLNISQCHLDFPEDLFSGVSCLAKEFISKLLVVEPGGRLSVDEALCHPWLSSGATYHSSPLPSPSVPVKEELDSQHVASLKRSSSPPKLIVSNKENDRNLLNSPLSPGGSSPPSKRECRETSENEGEPVVPLPVEPVTSSPLPPPSPRPAKSQSSPKSQPRTPSTKERGRVSRQIKNIEMRLRKTPPPRDGDGDDEGVVEVSPGPSPSPSSAASHKTKFTHQVNLKLCASPAVRRSGLNRSFGSADHRDQTKERGKDALRLSPLCPRREQSRLQPSSPHDQKKCGTRRDFQDIVIRNGYIY